MGIRCAHHVTPLYPQKLALTSPIGGGRSVGIVRSRTKATEFFYYKKGEMTIANTIRRTSKAAVLTETSVESSNHSENCDILGYYRASSGSIEDGADMLSRNVGRKLPLLAA